MIETRPSFCVCVCFPSNSKVLKPCLVVINHKPSPKLLGGLLQLKKQLLCNSQQLQLKQHKYKFWNNNHKLHSNLLHSKSRAKHTNQIVLIKIESSYNTQKKLDQIFGDSKYDSLIKKQKSKPRI